MMLYYARGKNHLIYLCQSDTQMQWMNLPRNEWLDLEKVVNGHRHILHVGTEKALFIGLTWVLPMEKKFPSFSKSNLC